MIDINNLIRENIRNMKAYSSARDEYKGKDATFLDANENPFNFPLNRYPDPLQRDLKDVLAKIKRVDADQIFLGNGSDEAIDLLMRIFCEPGKDSIVSIDPSYGMYKVCANINNITIREVSLNKDFSLDTDALLKAADASTKMMIICSPNNPTANLFNKNDILKLIKNFKGLFIIDEAYLDFCTDIGFVSSLKDYNNLVILQTFSKAWGMAGIRLGMALASKDIIALLNKIKYPYNVSIITQGIALKVLRYGIKEKDSWVKIILKEKEKVREGLLQFPFVRKIHPSDTNFLLVETDDPRKLYEYLVLCKIIVRDRSTVHLCDSCLRFTIGSPKETKQLFKALKSYLKNK